MHDIDVSSKAFFSVPRNFADVVNAVVFKGHPVIDPDDLKATETERISEDETKSFFVDIAKQWILKNLKVTLITIENQNYIDYGMVIRNMRTELLTYIKQVNEIKEYHRVQKDLKGDEFLSGVSKDDLLTPAITVVVYLGEEPWNGPRQLYDILDMDDKLALAVNNYKLNLFDYHDYEDTSAFKGEVRKLLELLKIRGDKDAIKEYTMRNRYMNTETGRLVSALIGVNISKLRHIKTMKGDVLDMCKGLEELCNDCRAEGLEQGIKQGLEQGIRATINCLKKYTELKEVGIRQLMEQFDLLEDEAAQYVEKYWE